MINQRLTLADLQTAPGIRPVTPQQQEAVRASFHSLIGDMWVAAILMKITKSNRAGNANPWILWDSDIPKPNKHTALAWYLILESPEHLIMGGAPPTACIVSLPESSDPRYQWVTAGQPDDSIAEPMMLPAITGTGLMAYFSVEDRKRLAQSNRNAKPRMFSPGVAVESDVRHTVECRYANHDDFMRKLTIIRCQLMQRVIVQPRMPMTLAQFTHRGLWLRPFATHGMGVQARLLYCEPESLPYRVTVPGAEADLALTRVPYWTPPVWMGFSPSERADAAFIAAYLAVRDSAIELLNAEAGHVIPAVVQPAWEHQLSVKGLLASENQFPGKLSKGQLKSFDFRSLPPINLETL